MESETLSRTATAVDDPKAAEALRHLRRRQAHLVPHGRKSLEEHLRGTYDILKTWHQPSRVCLAGVLHSGYSTEAFEHPLFRIEKRRRLRGLIGEEAEHLVYQFCSIHREEFFATLQTGRAIASPMKLANRRGGRAITVTQRDAGDLVVLYMANAVEQSCLSDGSPTRWLAHVSELGRWAKKLSEVVPPVFDRCTAIVSSDSEELLLETYNRAFQRVGEDPRQVMSDLRAAVMGAAWVPAPLIWLGFLSIAVGEFEKAADLGSQAEVALSEWGTPWDKRLLLGQWRTLAALLRKAGRHNANFITADLVSSALSSSGNSPAQLYVRLQDADLIPPAEEAVPKPPAQEALALTSILPARFEQYVASFHSNGGLPKSDNYYPGITTKPWHDPQQFPLARDLERAAPQILEEFKRVDMRLFQDEAEDVHREGRWSVLFLNERGDKKKKEIRDLLPVTASVIDAHEAVTHLAGVSYFSCLEPGTRVAPHRGPTNMRLRCHLGIEVPDQCGLKVDGMDGIWEQGRCIVFDDSFVHEVWNLSNSRRVVLIVDMWHPELTEDEVSLLKWVAA